MLLEHPWWLVWRQSWATRAVILICWFLKVLMRLTIFKCSTLCICAGSFISVLARFTMTSNNAIISGLWFDYNILVLIFLNLTNLVLLLVRHLTKSLIFNLSISRDGVIIIVSLMSLIKSVLVLIVIEVDLDILLYWQFKPLN